MECIKIATYKSETQICSIMSIYNTIKLVFFTLGPLTTRFLNDEFKFQCLSENEM